MSEHQVNLKKIVNAPIEQVFDAWLNPEMLRQFILPAVGMSEPEVSNDPREGGSFEIIMQVGEDRMPHTGTYLTLERPHCLVFSWQSAFSADDSQVTLDFTVADEGQTMVELTHVKFINEEACSNHQGGWQNILDKLAEVTQSVEVA